MKICNGELVHNEILVYGRKIPLLDIRKKLLLQHENWMRLPTDEQLEKLSHDDLVKLCNELGIEDYEDDIYTKIKLATRTRNLVFWHDHATILGKGYVVITVSVAYDNALFVRDNCLQSAIEEPEVHIIGLSSSSIDDQVSFVPDRYECLKELDEVLYTSNSIPIVDVARFFTGDHPAQSFERGTQLGGNYKCDGCGVQSHMMGDFVHVAHLPLRSLEIIKKIATNGIFGKQQGKLKPLSNLSVSLLKQELSARGQFDVAKLKPELMEDLTKCLKGVQRVPTMLIGQPTQSLSQCNLSRYEVLDSEPLHDIKGHLSNLFEELPYIVGPSLKKEITDIIENGMQKDKINFAYLRCLAIHCQMFLDSKSVEWKVKSLMATITEISHNLYRKNVERSPKMVLRLYNVTWLHHELCVDLFPTTKKVTMTKIFGTYFHSLLMDSPRQYEIISLSSVHTEKQERLFGQARTSATMSSNRKPENVIKSILLHLQSNSMMKKKNTPEIDSRVSRLAQLCPAYKGTIFLKSFIQSKPSSWQTHLERIAPFLVDGPGFWWDENSEYVNFYDGDTHNSFNENGPNLLHFRDCQLATVVQRSEKAWSRIILNKPCIPAKEVKIYDTKGDFMFTWTPSTPTSHDTDNNSTEVNPSTNSYSHGSDNNNSTDPSTNTYSHDTDNNNNTNNPSTNSYSHGSDNNNSTDPSINSYSHGSDNNNTEVNPSTNTYSHDTDNNSTEVNPSTNSYSHHSDNNNSTDTSTNTYSHDTDTCNNSTEVNPSTNSYSHGSDVNMSGGNTIDVTKSNPSFTYCGDDIVINSNEFTVPETNPPSVYTTKLAKALGQLLGASNDLKRFGDIRKKMKIKTTKNGLKAHDDILLEFQTQVLKERTNLKKKTSNNQV